MNTRNSEAILEGIRQRRETRDRLLLQDSIPILEILKRIVESWIDGEFKDLEEEIEQVDDFASRDSTIQRITEYRTDLRKIQTEKLPQALTELNDLIDYIRQQKFKSAKEATQTLRDKISPIVSIIFNLLGAREKFEIMAEMIPLPDESQQ